MDIFFSPFEESVSMTLCILAKFVPKHYFIVRHEMNSFMEYIHKQHINMNNSWQKYE